MLRRAAALLVVALATAAFAADASAVDRSVWAWGVNNQGELGNGSNTGPATCASFGACATSPVGVLNTSTVIAGGYDHSLAVRGGQVWAWGDNENGQLGVASGPSSCPQPCSKKPLLVKGFAGVVGVAAGIDFSLALLSNGSVVAWGANNFGQLGDGTTTNSAKPVVVSGLSNVIAIAAGGDHALALLSNHTLMAWGANNFGQLGDGSSTGPDACSTSTACSTTPVPVGLPGAGPLRNVEAIAAGNAFSVALAGSSFLQVETWGYNKDGDLGQGTVGGVRTTPSPISSLGGITKGIAANAASRQALALLDDGTVAAWGNNAYGQAGSGCGSPCPSPKLVPGLSNVSSLATSCGFNMCRSLALAGGRVLEWGSAPLGNGTFPGGGPTPVLISSLVGPAAIAAGGTQSLALSLPPPNRFSITHTQCICTVATLHVRLPGPGVLVAGPNIHHGALALASRKKPLIKRTKVTIARAGTVKLKIRLTAAGRRALKRKHKLKVKVLITFAPTGGSPASKTVTVTFKR